MKSEPVPTTGNTPEPTIESCPDCGAIYSMMEPGGITDWGCSNVFHSRGRVAASSKEATPTCTCGKSNYPCAVHNREDFNNCEVTRVRAQYEREAVERVLAARIKATEMGAEATPSPATKETHITPHGSVINTDLCVSCICGKHLIWRYLEDEDAIQVFHCDVTPAREETRHEALRLIEHDWHYGNLSALRDSLEQAYDAGARSVVVAPKTQTEVNRLRDAAARFYANRGYHTGPHDFYSHETGGPCRRCEEAYIAAEAEFDTAFGLSGTRDEVLAGVAALPSEEETKDGWISVEERLPDINAPTLVVLDVIPRSYEWNQQKVFLAARTGKDEWYSYGANCSGMLHALHITHWRELPAPPVPDQTTMKVNNEKEH